MTDLVRATDQFAIIEPSWTLAERIAKTDFVPSALRGKPEAVLAAILTGNELGLPPMTAINKIHVIEGRPSLSAEVMRALVQAAGHEIWLEESNTTKATVGGRRRDTSNASYITWTIDDANRANLGGKQNWKRYPRAMLVARATGELCRFLFSDVLAGISYTVEEVEDGFTLEGDDALADPVMDGRPEGVAPPKKPTSKRQRKPKKPPASPPPASAGPPLPGEEGYDDVTGAVAPEVIDAEATEADGPSSKSEFWRILREIGRDGDDAESRALRHAVIHKATDGATTNSQKADNDALEAACELLTQVQEGTWEVGEDERLIEAQSAFAWGETHHSSSTGFPPGWGDRAGPDKARATKAARALDDSFTGSFDDIGPALAARIAEEGA